MFVSAKKLWVGEVPCDINKICTPELAPIELLMHSLSCEKIVVSLVNFVPSLMVALDKYGLRGVILGRTNNLTLPAVSRGINGISRSAASALV